MSTAKCVKTTVVCDATNASQVTGAGVGVNTPAGKALAGKDGVVRVVRAAHPILAAAAAACRPAKLVVPARVHPSSEPCWLTRRAGAQLRPGVVL